MGQVKKTGFLLILPYVLLMLNSCMDREKRERENLFLTEYDTPHGTIPFDRIGLGDYLPAMREGMRLQNEEIRAIVENAAPPTFGNTVEALERTGAVLSKVQYAFYNLMEAETCDEMDSIANEISPEETEHANNIYLNGRLFDRVSEVYSMRDSLHLTDEQRMLLQNTYDAFVKRGATLSAADKERYRELTKELSLLGLQFQQNLLKSTNSYRKVVTDEAQLEGLPESIRAAASQLAKEKGEEGWLFNLSYPSYVPFMKYAANRELRRELYTAYNTKATEGDVDNRPIVVKLVNCRLKIARLLGFEDYASYVLQKRMAENKGNVYDLLDRLLAAYKPTALAEVDEVRRYAKAHGADFELMPWDWSYYSEKLREEKYSINDEQLKPYFELERVKRGVFGLATKLYGLRFEKNPAIPVYHPEVEAFDVFDGDGSFLAVLYTDFHPRDGKRSGAWMTEFKCQGRDADGTDHRPHISIVMNFTKPTGSEPSLLTFDELTTFLHEFGHSIHGMVAKTTYESLAGTNVYRDFVELPSQLMENWAFEKEYLDEFAVHYRTGEKIPVELVDKIRKAANFNTGYSTLRQLSFGYLDMAWHTLAEEFDGDVRAFELEAWRQSQVLPSVDGALMSVQFGHIFSGGYSAGYYSYKWAEVLDADAFSVFKGEGIFNKQTAARFRNEVLAKGGSEHPMTLYMRFRGQKPTIEPLLRRNGVLR